MGAGTQRWWNDDEARTPEVRLSSYIAATSAWRKEQTLELARTIVRVYPDVSLSMWSWSVAMQMLDAIDDQERRMLTTENAEFDVFWLRRGLPVLHPARPGAGVLPLATEDDEEIHRVATFIESARAIANVLREEGPTRFLERISWGVP